jgi:hypothetical protein
MKKIPAYFILVFISWCLASCYKDKGNYDYHPVNELSVANFDTLKGYVTYFGNTLAITPAITGTLDKDGTHSYTYEWSYELPSYAVKVLSTEKNLNYKVDILPGTYSLRYKITDKTSGVMYHFRTTLQVSTEIYEGYLVLNEVNNQSRLDMLSYKTENGSFIQYTDVLAKMGSALPPQGKPYNIFCMQTSFTTTADASSYKIYLSTASGTNGLNSESFGYTATQNIRYEMIGDVPQGFAANNFFGNYRFGTIPTIYMCAQNNVYIRLNGSPAYPYVPLNIYAGAAYPFKASPYTVSDPNYAMIFNMDKRTFTRTETFNSASVYDMPAALNYPTGKDLVYMEMPYSGTIHAIMKDPVTAAYSIIRFAFGAAPSYNELVPAAATDFDKATHYAISPDQGYLFYSVGGKLYEYDLSLKTSKLMLDKGTEEITYIAFQNFYARTNKPATYGEWARWLTVGSYNTAGTAGANGTLEQYTVPPVNGPIELKTKWTGFGKIVSISYRERR